MTRTTVKDVRSAFAAHVAALEHVGIPADGLVLTEGEGELIAYRINTRRGAGFDHPPIGEDYLGNTARDAYQTLTARTRAIYDTVRALRDAGRLVTR